MSISLLTVNIADLMQVIREDAERKGGNVEFQENGRELKVQAYLDDIEANYLVPDSLILLVKIVEDLDPPKDSNALVDAFWRTMNTHYVAG